MRPTRFIPLAALTLAVACSDTATSPTSIGGPMFLVQPGTYPDANGVTTLNAAGSPSGSHIQSGSPITCVVTTTAIVCGGTGPSGSYQLNGVGNKNATGSLAANWSATVDCTNNGGQLVEVKSTVQSAPATTGSLSPDNGHLIVPQVSVGTPTDEQFEAAAKCPNKNWTADVAPGDPTLVSFTYTLKFAGFQTAAISITAGP
jgi:hypothetical protein